MGTGQSPTFPRFQLGKQLRDLRERAGLTTEDVAAHVDCSSSTISRIEGGKVGVRRGALLQLLELYQVIDEAHRETLLALAKQGKQRGWFARFGDLPATYSRFIGLESAAVEMRDYEALVVPGLLQTEDYARALIIADPSFDAGSVETRVRVRMERQALLTRSDPLKFFAILDESVIRRQIGGSDVMCAQRKHLAEIGQLPNITIQVLPFSGGAYPGMAGSFAILDFRDTPSVVYAEALTGDIYQEADDVRRYSVVFENLRAAALSPSESARLIDTTESSAA
ncbi:MAG: helix-turn-helix domain-containing protein [Dactylosporangium sp.]|nr:helix-turn-helix domain-containing protein [Dactylosporangium sp.]NNJ61591.1 helix-turn-helix domain-containing protein [Dactylosporangium sp.]